MKELVEHIARALVDNPDEVEVKETITEHSVLLEVKVAAGDMGRIIGKQGKIAKAIRTMTKAAAIKAGKKVEVDILG